MEISSETLSSNFVILQNYTVIDRVLARSIHFSRATLFNVRLISLKQLFSLTVCLHTNKAIPTDMVLCLLLHQVSLKNDNAIALEIN